jgi:hypothetical protein
VKRFCAWHPGGRKFLEDVPPFDSNDETDGMCDECERRQNRKLDRRLAKKQMV